MAVTYDHIRELSGELGDKLFEIADREDLDGHEQVALVQQTLEGIRYANYRGTMDSEFAKKVGGEF